MERWRCKGAFMTDSAATGNGQMLARACRSQCGHQQSGYSPARQTLLSRRTKRSCCWRLHVFLLQKGWALQYCVSVSDRDCRGRNILQHTCSIASVRCCVSTPDGMHRLSRLGRLLCHTAVRAAAASQQHRPITSAPAGVAAASQRALVGVKYIAGVGVAAWASQQEGLVEQARLAYLIPTRLARDVFTAAAIVAGGGGTRLVTPMAAAAAHVAYIGPGGNMLLCSRAAGGRLAPSHAHVYSLPLASPHPNPTQTPCLPPPPPHPLTLQTTRCRCVRWMMARNALLCCTSATSAAQTGC